MPSSSFKRKGEKENKNEKKKSLPTRSTTYLSPSTKPHANENRRRRHPRLRRPLADRRRAPQRGGGGVHPAGPARRARARADAVAGQACGARARDRGVPARIAEIA